MQVSNKNSQVEKLEEEKGFRLMEEFMKNQPEEIKEKVRRWVILSKIKPQDPLFLLLLACRVFIVLLDKAPEAITDIYERKNAEFCTAYLEFLDKQTEQFKGHLNETDKYLNKIQTIATTNCEAKIAKGIGEILSKNGIEGYQKWSLSPRLFLKILGAASTALVMVGGFIGGYSFAVSGYATKEAVHLTPEEQVLLKWAKSREGQLARDLVTWNEDLLDKSCKKKVEALGVTIQIGKAQATNGYCWLWVEPASKRKFKVAES